MKKLFNSATQQLRTFVLRTGTVLILLLMLTDCFVFGQDNSTGIPLVEQQPFDMIKLDEINGNVELKILPLEKPLKEVPAQGFLIFEAPDLSDDRLQVPFQNITDYRSFNELLRAEANQFIRDEEYGKAFRNLIYIFDHGGRNDPTVQKTIQNLLFRDGAKNYLSGNFELALTIFQDIYERDKNFEVPGISKRPIDVILDCLDKNIAKKFADGKFNQVRSAAEYLELRYGESASELALKWKARLLSESDQMLQRARQIAQSGDGKLAHLTARRANGIAPGRPETLEVFQEIVAQYPIVFVGVSQTSELGEPLELVDWGARRIGKLTQRSVVEFAGPGDDGGRYEFLNGSIEQFDDDGYVFRFSIEPTLREYAAPAINAHQLSQRMLSHGSINSDEYDVAFAKIVKSVEIENDSSVVVRLKKAFVRPEALFQFLYESDDMQEANNGFYKLAERNEEISIFEKNPNYPPLEIAQHPQIVEWRFPSASQAVDALIAGEIDVVDRIPLADLSRLQENSAITVGSYIVPTVHMLIPNIRNDFTADRSFRNGLKQGINRERILRDDICGGREFNGSEIISGPFPIGTEENDQLSYAYNLKVVPQPFNDQLGMVLARVVYETQLTSMIRKGVSNPELEFPTLVLAYAEGTVSEIACVNIQQMWEAVGQNVVLRKLGPGEVYPADNDWDFLYYEMSMEEPVTNAELLFGPNGVVKNVSAPVRQNMQKLGFSDSWQNAAKTLRQIHRQVVNDVTVIPLWQIKEHFAFRENVTGIGKNPVHLYENVSRWKIQSFKKEND